MRLTAMEEMERNQFIEDKYNSLFDQRMKRTRGLLIKNLGMSNQAVLEREMQMANERIKFEIAWEIFEEVNEVNDVLKHIDLSCLDYMDAISIAKQKIFDLASHAQQEYLSKGVSFHYILNIKCADDHLVNIQDEFGRAPLKNCVLEMIRKELGIENYYIAAQRTILVRVDKDLLQN